jgi:AcrR family transcriptional regulator
VVKRRANSRLKKYHHGDLRLAVLAAAERILERDGIQGLTLRAVARAVGVSHTAPVHHFGDRVGLISELAAAGFRRYGAILAAAIDSSGNSGPQKRKAMGRAYVAFARAHPDLFALMFRSELLDMNRPSLAEAMKEMRLALWTASCASNRPLETLQQAARATASWALVHGFAILLRDGCLLGTATTSSVDPLLEAVLDRAFSGD